MKIFLPPDATVIAVKDIPRLIAEANYSKDTSESTSKKRDAVETMFKDAIKNAAMFGSFISRDAETLSPLPAAIGRALDESVLTIDEFISYAAELQIDVVVKSK